MEKQPAGKYFSAGLFIETEGMMLNQILMTHLKVDSGERIFWKAEFVLIHIFC